MSFKSWIMEEQEKQLQFFMEEHPELTEAEAQEQLWEMQNLGD